MNLAGRAAIFAAGVCLAAATPAGAQSNISAPPPTATPQFQSSQATPTAATPPASVTVAASAQESAVPAAPQPAVGGGAIRGVVKSGGEKNAIPLPGVSVTATNALTGEKFATVTDANGAFAMQIPKDGRYVVRSELAAFAVGTKSVLLNAENRSATVDLGMELASRVKENGAETIAGASAMGLSGKGTQALTLQGAVAGATSAGVGGGQVALPSASQSDTGLDAVSISGAAGSTSAAFNFDAARQSAEDQRDLQRTTEARGGSGTGYSGAQGYGILRGGRGGFFGGGSGAFRRFNPNAIHGSAVYQVTNSALNARNFAVTGQPESQPGYGTSRYGLIYSGPVIPKLLESKTDFLFIAAVGNHGSSLFDQSSIVPTAAERAGDFSALTDPITGKTEPLYNPYTPGTQYLNNNITSCTGPGCGISPIAAALLPYIPLPNQATSSPSDPNYRLLASQQSNSDQLNARYIHNFGSGAGGGMPLPPWMRTGGTKKLTQNLSANFSFQHTSEDEIALFPGFGGKDQLYQYVLSVQYSISKNAWTNTVTGAWNQTDSESRNFFTGVNNIAGNAGIQGVGLTPFFYGLPSLNFSEYAGGTEQQPSSRIQQTGQFSDNVSYIHKDHNVRMGGDIRRIFIDVIGGVQGTGGYTFSGFATQEPAASVPPGGTGSQGNSFADFLIGIPQQGKLQAPCAGNVQPGVCDVGSPKYLLRQNEFSLYAQDTWRVLPTLTLLYGLRYEYFSPYSEENDRIANLDPNANFTDVAVVTPNEVGPFGGKYPHSLIEPFRQGWAPRVGFASKAGKNTVVRGGYGINYNTSVYANFIQDLAYQRPFAIANNNTQSSMTAPTALFTLANGLSSLAVGSCMQQPCITNNYAVDKNYRMGYVQGWNLDIQQTLGKGYVLNVGYNGSKGTHLDGLLAPNRSPIFGTGPSTPNAQVFDYETSHAQSNFDALAVRLRKRLQNGIAIGATYTYSHSIDNASTIGGTTAVVAQEPTNLIDDLGNSSFDQRHVFKGDFTYELPFGPNGKVLNNGNWISHALAGLQFSGDFQFATGEPLNPYYAAAANEVASGVTNSLRPDRVPGSSLQGGPSQLQEWFNVNAFTPLNAADVTRYGTAGRNSIPGPGVREFDSSFSKYLELGGTRSMEFRLTANNVFNVVQYNNVGTAIDSFNAGRVLSASAMRNLLVLARYRF
jgi:hypothetical protein